MRFSLKKIKNLRKSLKLTQKDFAELLDMDTSNYGRRESGKVPFSISEIERLSESLDVDLTYFFDGVENEFSGKKIDEDVEKWKIKYYTLLGQYRELEKRFNKIAFPTFKNVDKKKIS